MSDDGPAAWMTDGPAKIGDKIGMAEFGPFASEALARYAQVSGDDNPLHLDLAMAQAAGFAANPVHGMLMFACFEPYLMRWRKNLVITRLSAKFLCPVLAGESIHLSGRVLQASPHQELTLRLFARNPRDEIAILAEAAVWLATPKPV